MTEGFGRPDSAAYPERYEVRSGAVVSGCLRPPSSKSVTHRYLNLALLCGETTLIERPLASEDISLFLRALASCGFEVERDGESLRLRPRDGRSREGTIECGNAGTMYRFVVASLTAVPGRWRIDGTPRLRQRPIAPLVDALRQLGAEVEYLEREGAAPLQVTGGSLVGGMATLDAAESSQYLSALLMAAQRAQRPVDLDVRSLTSGPYVDVTLEALARFGAAPVRQERDRFHVEPATLAGGRFEVEADYSAAAYPASAAVLTGGEVRLEGLRPDSAQGDRRFLHLLQALGGGVEETSDGGLRVASSGSLTAIDADLSEMPDQVPTLAAVAAFCRGTTRIRNVPHLRFKESDRLRAMATELARLGVEVEETEDGLNVDGTFADGPVAANEVVVDTWDDHRIAMSLALVGLRRPGVVIRRPGVVSKSYPGFWRDLEGLFPD